MPPTAKGDDGDEKPRADDAQVARQMKDMSELLDRISGALAVALASYYVYSYL